MKTKPVKKAIIAAAGFGTRFLPQTKAMPKEMLPLVDKPIIQYIVEQLVDAGIEDIVIVTGYHKRSIEDHFDQMSADLLANLQQGGKDDLLAQTERISDLANIAYVRQKGPYGTTTPILNASHLISDEPFIYTYADDLIVAEPNHFKQMVELYEELKAPILPCIKVTKDEDYDRYGILVGESIKENLIKMSGLVEKPGKAQAPSDMASVGGYLLTPDAFDYARAALKTLKAGQEFYLVTYVIEPMIRAGKALYATTFPNSRYCDTGNKLEYLKTMVDFALDHPDVGPGFRDYLRDLSLH